MSTHNENKSSTATDVDHTAGINPFTDEEREAFANELTESCLERIRGPLEENEYHRDASWAQAIFTPLGVSQFFTQLNRRNHA